MAGGSCRWSFTGWGKITVASLSLNSSLPRSFRVSPKPEVTSNMRIGLSDLGNVTRKCKASHCGTCWLLLRAS